MKEMLAKNPGLAAMSFAASLALVAVAAAIAITPVGRKLIASASQDTSS